MTEPNYTADELMAVCISRQIQDGELVAQGISTPLVVAGILLAKLTHAPNISFASAIGQAICFDWAPLSVARIEQLWIKQGLLSMGFVEAVCDFLPRQAPTEFFRPGQVDSQGNFNNIFIGGNYHEPRLRLPGSGGIADVTVSSNRIYLYVPRHGRHTFVKKLDFCSGLGHNPARFAGSGPRYLISDLGQFDFDPDDGSMRLLSLHKGVSLRRLVAKTGFELRLMDDIPHTEPPNIEELRLLREVIDPFGTRILETLAGADRKRKLRVILEEEKQHSFR